MKCRVCSNEAKLLFKGLVLNKYQVSYYKCPNCDFIQTETPYWMKEAYDDAITGLDIGLVSRNFSYSDTIEGVIENSFVCNGKFLDYAGGYGLFVRLMRDKGFDFYREDKYCKNIFAQYHDLDDDMESENKFEALTAFEVFEHLESPLEEIEKMFEYSDSVIFSTELQPKNYISTVDDWWYFTPETGQHVSFYSEKTLRFIANKFSCYFFTNNNLHLISKRKFEKNPLIDNHSSDNENMKSLIQSDFEFAKNIIAEVSAIKKEVDVQDENDKKNENLITNLSLALIKIGQLKKQLESTREILKLTNAQLESSNLQLESNRMQLHRIYSSREWRAGSILQKIFEMLIPKRSFIRTTAVIVWRFIKLIRKAFLKKLKDLENNILPCRDRLLDFFKPRKKRKINKKSKKIVYVGHSYHDKTKSTEFLTDYLKQFYDVRIVLDESWRGQGELYPDLSFIDESYLGVVFFQNMPGKKTLEGIKNDNIIFFPMYDGVGLDYSFWANYRGLKIMNFSRTLHDKLLKWKFDSMYVQYFPKPQEFFPGEKNEVFFWQRITRINIDTMSKLFGKNDSKMHIHKAIDPNQQFRQPSAEQEKKYQITYSDWFDTREEMWDVIKKKGIYVAPRELEGLGQSFLEAMAMGKAVVGVDNPTMNEYIKDGKTGYLFDLKNTKEIDLSDIKEVQKNTYKYMKDGYNNWKKDRHKIIEFIEKE